MVSEKQQKSVDRARLQSHLIPRRSLDELRKLKKGRTIQEQLADQNPTPKPTPPPDPAPGNMDALMALAESQLAERFRESGMSSFCLRFVILPQSRHPSAKISPGTPLAPAAPAQNTKNAVEVRPLRP